MKTLLLSLLANLLALGLSAATPSYDATVALDGSGDHTSVQAAVDAAPANATARKPWTIFVKNGFYREFVRVPADKPFLRLVGEDRERTVIHEKINRGGRPAAGQWSLAWEYSSNNPNSIMYRRAEGGAVLNVQADDFYAENISFVNDWGMDTKNGPQALALYTTGDRVAFHNCAMRSFQDTWQTARVDTHRGYAKNCIIEGAVDFIYGTGNYYFDSCTIFCNRDATVIVAPNQTAATEWGYVFESCTIDGLNARGEKPQKVLFGRPWHAEPIAVWLNTTILVEMAPEGWADMGGLPRAFSEWHSRDVWGNNIDGSNRKTLYRGRDNTMLTKRVDNSILSDDQAARYTYRNVLGDWDPRALIN